MKITARLNYLRIAPRKVRLVADLIRKKKVEEAQTVLNFTRKRASEPLLKLLNSAISNAVNNFQLDAENLYIAKITVDEGPKLKRWRPRARGRAVQIQKKTSHISLVLEEIDSGYKKIKKARKLKNKVSEKLKESKKEIKDKKEKPVSEKKEEKKYEFKPKFRPQSEMLKPRIVSGIKKIFRRKSI